MLIAFALLESFFPPNHGGLSLISYSLFAELLGVTSDLGSQQEGSC